MNLPILEIPEEISQLCQSYQPLFSKPQYKQFERFITAVMVADEANIEALAEGYRLSQSYDRLHHFAAESPWEVNDVLEHTVSIIKALPYGQCFHDKGILIIDDTLIEKYGRLMESVGKLYDHSQGRYLKYAHCLVGLCWSDHKKLRYPLRFELYHKKQECEEKGLEFKTKIELAIEMVNWAVEQGIPFSTVVFDSWFFCKETVDHIESLRKDWICMSKSDRKVAISGQSYTCKTYAQTLNPDNLRKTKVKGIVYRIQSVQARFPSLKRGHTTVRLVVCCEKEEKGGGYKEPVFLVSNRKDIRPQRLLRAYQLRWNIETFFKDAKSHLGLGEYQMRRLNGIKSHWCLVFTSAVILELVRWEVCTKEGLNVAKLTFGDLKRRAMGQTLRAIVRKVMEYTKQGLDHNQVYAMLQI